MEQQIRIRWLKTDAIFMSHLRSLEEKRRLQYMMKMLDLARERQFLLEVKRRHTGTIHAQLYQAQTLVETFQQTPCSACGSDVNCMHVGLKEYR